MDAFIAGELYASQYAETHTLNEFQSLLEKGLFLLEQNKHTDKVFIYRYYKEKELEAVLIALAYNEKVLVRFLKDEA